MDASNARNCVSISNDNSIIHGIYYRCFSHQFKFNGAGSCKRIAAMLGSGAVQFTGHCFKRDWRYNQYHISCIIACVHICFLQN